ncbi:MAG: UDP-glucose 4-epimerase GalE [Saprospiraceae bacterium]|jgi:UDP-glucose 4-epimerase|nr:UDP-glucose 4-epimerase GalE [Saprospiraceae bacterium]
MKILVTGGAGFIGSHTVVSLTEAGLTPVILDNFSNSNPEVLAGLEKILGFPVIFYEGDCNDPGIYNRIFTEHEIGGVIHFAACKAVGESMERPLMYYRNNLGSLMTLLTVMEQHQIRNLIFSSSCTVYGEPDTVPVTEQTPVKEASSVYGNTKQIGEEILRDVASVMPFSIISLRYFNPVGAHPSGLIGELPTGVPNNLVPFVTQTAAGIRESFTVFGNDYPTPDGTCIRDYIHVMDLAEAHVAALSHLMKVNQEKYYDVFNVGTGTGNSVLEVVNTFDRVNNLNVPHRFGPRRSGDVIAIWGNVDKSAGVLGWKARRSLADALKDAWNWQSRLPKP